MGVPTFIIDAVRKLYHRAWVSISFCGLQEAGFWALRGIKQGCPLSGSLFCLGFDPILRYMQYLLPPQLGVLGVFADDTGISSSDFFATLVL
eukprot:2776520-Pyramimonas_sp.AAC.1